MGLDAQVACEKSINPYLRSVQQYVVTPCSASPYHILVNSWQAYRVFIDVKFPFLREKFTESLPQTDNNLLVYWYPSLFLLPRFSCYIYCICIRTNLLSKAAILTNCSRSSLDEEHLSCTRSMVPCCTQWCQWTGLDTKIASNPIQKSN